MPLQEAGYPADEAASTETLRFRLNNGIRLCTPPKHTNLHPLTAPELFLLARKPNSTVSDELVGYVCATRSAGATLTLESMSTHNPHGGVCFHTGALGRHAARTTHRHSVHP